MDNGFLDNIGLSYFWEKIKAFFAWRVSNATNGHLAGLDADGNPTDSGYYPSDFLNDSVTLNIATGTYGVQPKSLCAFYCPTQETSMAMTSFTTSGGTSAKTMISGMRFPIGCKIYYYNGDEALDASDAYDDVNFFTSYNDVDGRYSAVAGSELSLGNNPTNTHSSVYLHVNVTDAAFWYPYYKSGETSELIVSSDQLIEGHFYIYLGKTVSDSGYEFQLEDNNPLYYYEGTVLLSYASYLANSSQGGEYTIAKLQNAEQGYFSSYVLQKDGVQVGSTINIPKDYMLKSGTVEVVTVADTPYTGAAVGDKYLDLIVNTSDNSGTTAHVYVPLTGVGAVYTAGQGIVISNNNVISAKIDGTQSNGLALGENGLYISTVTPSVGGVGGGNGAMTAVDKEKLDELSRGCQSVLLNGYSGSSGIQPWSLCAFALSTGGTTMYMTSFTNTAGSGGGAPITGSVFPIGCKIYYHPDAQHFSSATAFVSKKFYSSYNEVDGRYSSVTGQSLNLGDASASTVYLHVMVSGWYWAPYYKAGASFENIVTSNQLQEGHFYIYLGKTIGSSGYKFQLEDNNPLYFYNGTNLIDWSSYFFDALSATFVQSLTVGTTTTGEAGTNANVVNSGTASNVILDFTIPRGADAVNPFKGWYSSYADLYAEYPNPEDGDFAYVQSGGQNDPVDIYSASSGYWRGTGHVFNPANNQEFASGEALNQVSIINNLITGGVENVLSAQQGVVLLD